MNHDKKQRIAEKTAISERFVRIKPASVQANACIPGVFEKTSIVNPIRKEKNTTFVRELPTGIFSMK